MSYEAWLPAYLVEKTDYYKQFINKCGVIMPKSVDCAHLLTAFIHKSFSADHKEPLPHNERLEFLGDSILGAAINTMLYNNFDDDESALTLYKILLVKEETLALVAKDIGLDKMILLGNGEERMGGRQKAVILADALEALIGYIFLECGRDQAYRFVAQHVYTKLENLMKHPVKSYKSMVQEMIQKATKITPEYIDTEKKKDKKWNILVYVSELVAWQQVLSVGEWPSKKKAQEEAAKKYYESQFKKHYESQS